MTRQQQTPNFTVRVFVYHPRTGEFIFDYVIDQVVSKRREHFNRTLQECWNQIESDQAGDRLRYVVYTPVWESWRIGGNRLVESVLR